jgi:hypothetical protein
MVRGALVKAMSHTDRSCGASSPYKRRYWQQNLSDPIVKSVEDLFVLFSRMAEIASSSTPPPLLLKNLNLTQ